ncbi:adenylate/guanylate cyclase domain-containing protein [Ferruginibacter lapsinanis]|uniref:adenylate/guanylate cyclase domain-containing protein n=1 Tax=Ferruginibacter lapsinanis TaxID=563172 RepID=UPI001E384C01|nr:adenylate/guanylate cyclase domain-containing protein [Ferruginibacter lapsinanis]UEG49103.1 adenylate/guanylate cyclase domain-containing protein [Ferruginibacter lapsinanis]
MKSLSSSYSVFSVVGKYRMRSILYIAVFWTLIDIVVTILVKNEYDTDPFKSFLLREIAVFMMSCVMGYLFVFTLKNVFRKKSLVVNFIFKSIILLAAAFAMNFLIHFIDTVFIIRKDTVEAIISFFYEMLQTRLLIQHILYWLILFTITQLYIEINEKYSPGVFIDIIIGKYIQPKIEKRIIMFIDLKDSTPIAEKLGHVENFKFIRDFIFHVSMALIEHDGRIYQYVGDEVVVSWLFEKKNTVKCMNAIIEARKNLQRNGAQFRRSYDIIPEFRVGIHVGDVTVGEIGVIKRDLAMSGDTMNTAARIRSACNELNQKFIMSKDFVDSSDLKEWQGESLGIIDLKGKASGIELFSLKI